MAYRDRTVRSQTSGALPPSHPYQPSSDTHHLAALEFEELVKDGTGGAIEITVHPAGELGNDPGVLKGVRLGTIDIQLPCLFESCDDVYKGVDGDIGEKLLGTLEASPMEGLVFREIGFRKVTNSK
jgi:TRAP-type C4-dicarboxylate transport system substrate-binding protein